MEELKESFRGLSKDVILSGKRKKFKKAAVTSPPPKRLSKTLSPILVRLASIYVNKAPKFLDLPFEIRSQIYQILIQNIGLVIHDMYAPFRWRTLWEGHRQPTPSLLKCSACSKIDSMPSASHPSRNQNHAQFYTFSEGDEGGRDMCYCLGDRSRLNPPSSVQNLLRTGHQIRAELLEALYTQVPLRFTSIRALDRFLLNAPNDNLRFIRTIELHWTIPCFIYQYGADAGFYTRYSSLGDDVKYYRRCREEEASWELACEALSTMPLLANVHIVLPKCNRRVPEKALLGPLAKVTGLKSFLVELPWSEESANDPVVGDVPFQILRAR